MSDWRDIVQGSGVHLAQAVQIATWSTYPIHQPRLVVSAALALSRLAWLDTAFAALFFQRILANCLVSLLRSIYVVHHYPYIPTMRRICFADSPNRVASIFTS